MKYNNAHIATHSFCSEERRKFHNFIQSAPIKAIFYGSHSEMSFDVPTPMVHFLYCGSVLGITFQFGETTRTNTEIFGVAQRRRRAIFCSGVLQLQLYDINYFNIWNHLFFVPSVCCSLKREKKKEWSKRRISIFMTHRANGCWTNLKWNLFAFCGKQLKV